MPRRRGVVILSGVEAEPRDAAIRHVLDRAAVLRTLARAATRRRCEPHRLRVAVAVELSLVDTATPSGVDPRSVEALLDALGAAGYESTTVIGALPEANLWRDNSEPRSIADIAGYRFVTDAGRSYDVVGAEEDAVPLAFPETSALHGCSIARAWAHADVRIVFAKNKVHPRYRYALAAYTLMGVLAYRDRRHHAGDRLQAADVASALLGACGPDVVLVDALVSLRAVLGGADVEPVATGTMLAGDDALAVDFVAALKMGLDPYASALTGDAMRGAAIATACEIDGDAGGYRGWTNVAPLFAAAVDASRREWATGAVAERIATHADRTIFAERNVVLERANALVERWAGDGPNRALRRVLSTFAVYAAGAAVAHTVVAWRTNFAKHQLARVSGSINVDPNAYDAADYEAIEPYVDALEGLIMAIPPSADGIRLLRVDGANLFAAERTIDLPFEELVARVDVARAISLMNDYAGGRTLVVSRDAHGRPIQQLERNVYLTQPNYVAATGGRAIDVTKLELVRREPDRHRIVWRTVSSDNDTADRDDGTMAFERIAGGTRIRIAGLQRFRLPLVWQVVRVELAPRLLELLTRDAYRTYVDGTVANVRAAFDGDDVTVGYAPDAAQGEDDRDPLDAVITRLGERAGNVAQSLLPPPPRPAARADEHGYHEAFPRTASPATRMADAFLAGLVRAIRRDVGT